MNAPPTSPTTAARAPTRVRRVRPRVQAGIQGWWPAVDGLTLIALVLAVHAVRLTDLPIRGEESRWARIALEMHQTGDWVVPRLQGEPFLSRPPLGSWLIALAGSVRGDCDLAAVRLPSVLATLLTTLLIYGYGRTCLSRLGALAAGTAFATMAQVMELGRLAETEAVFTLLVSAALLVWHWGYVARWPAAWTWVAGYGLAALATLTKGPQAPVYFTAVVGLYLLARDRHYLVSRSHGLGILVFLAVVGAWQVPFAGALGWPGVRQIWSGDAAMRFTILDADFVAKHLLTYPLEILSCTLPWSLLLGFYLSRSFRRGLGKLRGPLRFWALILAVTFPTCWLVPGAQSRYFMPLYPVLALLVGLVVQRGAQAEAASGLGRVWRWLLTLLAPALGIAGGVVAGAGSLPGGVLAPLAQTGPLHWMVGLAAGAVAVLVWLSRRSWQRGWGPVVVLAMGSLCGLLYTGLVIAVLVGKSEDAAPAVARLREQLRPGQRLVSLGPVHHRFAYLYREPLPPVPWPKQADDLDPETAYFCFDWLGGVPVWFPFSWEEVAVIPCDRYRGTIPQSVVVVGRRR